jgi:hypothetical protein
MAQAPKCISVGVTPKNKEKLDFLLQNECFPEGVTTFISRVNYVLEIGIQVKFAELKLNPDNGLR